MPQINIKPKHLKQVIEILKTHVPEAEVWAYGSRLGDYCHNGSDLDLIVRNKSNLNTPVSEIPVLRESFSQSNIPFLVDIHDWARIPESFREQILRNYVVIQ